MADAGQEHHRPRNFVAYLLAPPLHANPLVVLLLLTACTLIAEKKGLLAWFERLVGDLTLSLVPGAPPEHVVIVAIDDEHYETEFLGRSPLDARTDGSNEGVLENLILRISEGQPRVIVVDIDTAHPGFAGLGPRLQARLPKDTHTSLVWFRDWAGDEAEGHPREYLGRQPAGFAGGIGTFPVDSDGMVRRYIRQLGDERAKNRERTSLAWKAAEAYCDDSDSDACRAFLERAEDSQGRVERPLLVFPRSPLVGLIGSTELGQGELRPASILARDLASGDWWKKYVANRIVVLGGTYEAGRDLHRTAFGDLSGVALWAASIENELRGPVIEFHSSVLILLDLVAGLLLIYFFWRRRFPSPGTIRNLAVNVIGILVLPWLVTVWIVNNFGLLVSFVPIATGLWLHQLHHLVDAASEHERAPNEATSRSSGSTGPE